MKRTSALPQSLTTVTPFSKALALLLVVFFPFAAFLLGVQFGETHLQPQLQIQSFADPSPIVEIQKSAEVDPTICDFTLELPQGYQYQEPINSFFGISQTNPGKICKVILGPNFHTGYEGFSGEQIQINAYPVATTRIETLLIPGETSHNQADGTIVRQTMLKQKDSTYRFQNNGYGGIGQVLLIQNGGTYYELIWRDTTKNLEPIVQSLAAQLK